MHRALESIFCVSLVCAWALGHAGVSLAEAERLDGELTPVGAQRAANREGTIPSWTGGIQGPPDDFVPGQHETDPFPNDQPLHTITAENAGDYVERLSEGQKALLAANPDTWRMHVYQSRRTASYPAFVYEALRTNATHAEFIATGKQGVSGSIVSSPFPIPRNGVEIIWNHSLRWRGIRISRAEGSAAVTRRGNYRVTLSEQDFAFPYGIADMTRYKVKYPELMFAAKSKFIAPSLLAGDGLLVLEPVNQTDNPRKVWQYRHQSSRILRSPHFAYGVPAPSTDGLRTVDEFGLFNGPTDRFEWELLGKRELYIPYNAYRLHSGRIGYSNILHRRHLNPELARYELHRVWVVEARLKDGQQHVYSRRTFYVDEDSWQIAVSDTYDMDGALWRAAEAHAVNFYTVPVVWSTLEVFYDLKQQRYLVNGLDNKRHAYRFDTEIDPREFSPNALNYYVR